jgi:hypothetical protein
MMCVYVCMYVCVVSFVVLLQYVLDLVSADLDLNRTGLIRLWLQQQEEEGGGGRVAWTVRAVSGHRAALAWLERLKSLKGREQESETYIRSLL